MTRIEADYKAPAKFDDVLEVETSLLSMSAARLVLEQTVQRGETLIFKAKVTLVLLDAAGRPSRLPAEIRRLAD